MTGRLLTRRARADEAMPLEGHLDELRRRVMVSAAVLVVALAAAYALRRDLMRAAAAPLPDGAGQLITLSPTEPFMTTLTVVFWVAVAVSAPLWVYQAYAFVAPALGDASRRTAWAVSAGLSGLFLAGAAFGYLCVLPVALGFLLGFDGHAFHAQLRAGEYYGFATSLVLASGVMFLLPAVMAALSRSGVVPSRVYARQWRMALVVMAAIAALLPGGDPASMALLMAPQLALYALGIVIARRVERRGDVATQAVAARAGSC